MKSRGAVYWAVLAAIVVGAVMFWPRAARPCRATFKLVQEGMTLEEVATTVGGPPGVYTRGPVVPFIMCGFSGHRAVEWHASDATLTVIYGGDGRVFCASVTDPLPDRRSLWERIRVRLSP